MIAVAGAAAATTCIPLTESIHFYWLAQGIAGFQSVGIDVACFSWVIEMWYENANPYMLGLYLGLAIGTMISSVVAEPFLSHVDHVHFMSDNETVTKQFFHPSQIMIPYAIVSCAAFMAVILLLVMYFMSPYVRDEKIRAEREQASRCQDERENVNETNVATIVVIGSVMFACHIASEINTQSFLPAFAVFSPLHLTKSHGAFMLSLFSASGVVSLCVAIWIATRISATIILNVSMTILATGIILLTIAASTSEYLMWLSVILMGMGYASVFPCMYTYISEEIGGHMPSWMFGSFSFSKSVARMITPLITGQLIETQSLSFVFVNIVSFFFTILMITALRFRGKIL